MGMKIEPATCRQAKGRMLLFGPSGSGKTVSALRVAQGMGDRILLIDTENRSSEKYVGVSIEDGVQPFALDIIALDPPYSPQRYMEALGLAASGGYDVCVMDSISHEWNGTGGVQEIVDAAKARFGGNSQAAWSVGTPLHNKFLESILAAPFHIVATARSKVEWVPGEDSRGRQVFVKAGMGAVQRDSIEYEFDVTLLLDPENSARVEKTRASRFFPPLHTFPKLTEETGRTFSAWLSEGTETSNRAPEPPPVEPEAAAPISQERQKAIDEAFRMIEELQQDFGDYSDGVNWTDQMAIKIGEWWSVDEIDQLTVEQLDTLINRLRATRTKKQQDQEAGVA